MLDRKTAVMLRLVLDEVCADVGQYENAVRTHVASRLLEAATVPGRTIEDLKLTGREALSRASMTLR